LTASNGIVVVVVVVVAAAAAVVVAVAVVGHSTHHSLYAAVNHFDLLLRSGLTRRLPPNN